MRQSGIIDAHRARAVTMTQKKGMRRSEQAKVLCEHQASFAMQRMCEFMQKEKKVSSTDSFGEKLREKIFELLEIKVYRSSLKVI